LVAIGRGTQKGPQKENLFFGAAGSMGPLPIAKILSLYCVTALAGDAIPTLGFPKWAGLNFWHAVMTKKECTRAHCSDGPFVDDASAMQRRDKTATCGSGSPRRFAWFCSGGCFFCPPLWGHEIDPLAPVKE
jgi:hypothetical protein